MNLSTFDLQGAPTITHTSQHSILQPKLFDLTLNPVPTSFTPAAPPRFAADHHQILDIGQIFEQITLLLLKETG